MLKFIDISSYQGDIDLSVLPIDAVIIKATEATSYVNPYCDSKVSQAKQVGLPWGFYHFAQDGTPEDEADYFIQNCEGYFGEGIPVLDWEENQSVEWVNDFVNRVHEVKGVWCWIYGNPWRFNQGGVSDNCGIWVAAYPDVLHPTFDQAEQEDIPETIGNVIAWQFCSDGRLDGYGGDLDCSLFYGTRKQWGRYAQGDNPPNHGNADNNPDTNNSDTTDSDNRCVEVVENDKLKVTIERK